MSFTAARAFRRDRRFCECCRERKARFQHHGHVKADRDHTLCFACFRAERERRRARLLADAPSAVETSDRVTSLARPGARALTEADLAHRRRMLAHLRATAGSR